MPNSSLSNSWFPLTTTSFAAIMAVNDLVTGLIVFRILRVYLEVKAASTSVERTLSSTDGTKYWHIVFVIIESGITLFVIQLVRTLLYSSMGPVPSQSTTTVTGALFYSTTIGEIFNVIIRSVHSYFFCFTENIFLARASHQQ